MPLKLSNGGGVARERTGQGDNGRHAKEEDERMKGERQQKEERTTRGRRDMKGKGETIATKEELGGRWGAY